MCLFSKVVLDNAELIASNHLIFEFLDIIPINAMNKR